MKITAERLEALFEQIGRSEVAVIGDLMLDRYVWGVAERISPEAPVPVVTLTGESSNLGGAANVAANVSSLGARSHLIGLIGNDSDGTMLREIVSKSGLSDYGLVVDESRPTSVKTRVIAQNQHVVRIDRELAQDASIQAEEEILDRFRQMLPNIRAVILEDYNKGTLTPRVIETIIKECRARGLIVGVDPKKQNFRSYKGATIFKPNLKEMETAVGRTLRSDSVLEDAANKLIAEMSLENLLVTRGEHGMGLFNKEGASFIATKAHRVHDVSGAGDTVIATMITAMAGGADVYEAATLANNAASIVIAEIGAVPVSEVELRRVTIGRVG